MSRGVSDMAIKGVVDIDQLAKEINKTLQQYANGVGEEIGEVAEKVAKDGVKTLKVKSPKLTGGYAKGWRAKKVGSAWVVHNATDYQLTHLLEKSYALRDGGRSTPQVHIAPVEQDMIDEYTKGVEEVIRNG